MKKKNRKIIIIIIYAVFALFLSGDIFLYAGNYNQVKKFNNELHSFTGTYITQQDKQSDFSPKGQGDVTANFYFRGNSNDTWTKDNAVAEHEYADFVGTIYEMKLTDNSLYEISDWYMRLNIHQDCYLNNAWSGTVEVHQFGDDGTEHVQTLDLRNSTDTGVLSLDYQLESGDFLISLSEGDYIIYHPSAEAFEYPISSQTNGTSGSITSGFIFYYWAYSNTDVNGMDLSDSTFYYHYNKNFRQGDEYQLIILLFAVWALAFLAFVIIRITLRASDKKLAQRDEFIDEALTVFTHFVDAKDPYTKGHSNRVAIYSTSIAEAMGMSENQCKNVYYIALLHDVGKCYIDDKILKKPDRLSAEEFEQIKTHTTLGANMLKDLKSLPEIYNGALYHHERYDGKGYPSGKAGNDIPLIGRIICVADSFDAMNSDRCYRPKLSPEDIREEIKRNRGTQFDPEIADIFLKLLDEGKINY